MRLLAALERVGITATLVGLAAVLVTLGAPSVSTAQPACTISWDGGATGAWHEAANWTGDALPGPADHVCIPTSVTVEVSQDVGSVLTVQSQGTLAISDGSLSVTDTLTLEGSTTTNLILSGGTLGGTGNLTVTGSFEWTAGVQTGTGTTTIASGATLTIDTDGFKLLETRTLANNGLVNWSAGEIRTRSAAVIENAGTFDVQFDGRLFNDFGAQSRFHNTGTLRKSAGSGTASIDIPLDNDTPGTVQVAGGTLQILGSVADEQTGQFSALADATLLFATGTFNLGSGASITGAGASVISTTVEFNAAIPATNLVLSGGTLGGTGNLTVTGSFEWTAGVQTGTGTTTIASGATLTIDTDGFKLLETRTLANNGLVNWSAGEIRTRSAAVIENAGTFDVQFDGRLFNDFGAQSRFHNTGTLRKSAGSGTASIDIPLDNDTPGTVQVAGGTLQILGSVADEQTGQFSALADATLQFGGGNLVSGSNVSGGGTVAFTAGTTMIAGTYSPANTSISEGTVEFNASPTITNLVLSGGTLGGTGNLTVTGSFEWTAGVQTGTGTTTIASGATLTIDTDGFKLLETRTLANNGLVNWSAGEIRTRSAAVIENAGTFDVQFDGRLFNDFGAQSRFHNTGTLRKSAGSGTASIDIPLDNDTPGTVQVAGGTLQILGSVADEQTGQFSALADATLLFATGTFNLGSGASITGAGASVISTTVEFNAAIPATNLVLSGGTLGGTGNLTVTGSFEWTAGVQTGTGTTTIASGATLTIDTDGFKLLETRTLANNGLVNWSAGEIRTRSAAVIENAGTFDVQFDGRLFNDFGAQSRFHNTGTLRKSAGSGTASIDIPLDNDGTVEVRTGIWGVSSYTQSASGTLHLHVGGLTPGTGFTQLDATGAVSLDGTLRITTDSGFAPALGQSFRILNANPRTGTFSSIQGTDAGGGLAYTVQYDAMGATLVVDDVPELSIGDVSVSEGDSGERSANFVVTLSRAAAQDVTVDFSTADGSASAPADYTAGSGQLTIAAGQTTGQIAVAVQSDTLDEPDETFLVNLTNAVNARISDAQATGTILDDDAPELSIGDVSVSEGDSGERSANFVVTLSRAAAQDVTVDFSTADGSASAPADYTAASGQLTIAAGQTTGQIAVAVQSDTLDEPDETFLVNLTNAVNARISDAQATGTILDDDAPELSIGDVSVSEGDSGERSANFVVTLSRAAAQDVTVDFSTADGSASAPADYTAASGQLTIAAGQTTGQIAVAVQSDTLDEPDETFLVNLTNAVNARISDAQATGTILDDDAPVSVPGCEVSGKGVIKAANGDWATFRFDVESGPRPRGRARYRDRGPAGPLKLKSSQITEVTVSADERHATILGKGKINRAGSFDFAIEVNEVPHAPDSFHIRLNDRYDSGKQRILKGDVDIECEEDDDDDRHDKDKKS